MQYRVMTLNCSVRLSDLSSAEDSSMQSKRRDSHHKWLHREKNDS